MHPYVLLRNQYQNQRGKNFRHSLYWIFTPGIALESWKILSGNFLFLELKNPGKFCPGRKLSWNFLKIISQKKYFSWNLQFWNFPFLEFSIPGILSWNFLFLESYFTEFSCYRWNVFPWHQHLQRNVAKHSWSGLQGMGSLAWPSVTMAIHLSPTCTKILWRPSMSRCSSVQLIMQPPMAR